MVERGYRIWLGECGALLKESIISLGRDWRMFVNNFKFEYMTLVSKILMNFPFANTGCFRLKN
jgi:hypothetical protein